MKRYWVSWVCESEDYFPKDCPPNDRILGWWYMGAYAKRHVTLAAVVEGTTPEEAREAVFIDWPEARQTTERRGWRVFNEISTPDWRPGDRFPLSEWMEKRFAKRS